MFSLTLYRDGKTDNWRPSGRRPYRQGPNGR